MWEVDLDQFWKDDELAHKDNCFYKGNQVALGIRMSDECVFAELGEEGTPWAPIPRQRRLELNKRYNDKAEKIVGRRLLRETLPDPRSEFPYVKRIGEVFGGKYIYENDTEWLTQSVDTPEELSALLDRVDKLDMREFMLPANWEAEKKRIYEEFGLKPGLMRHIRGPVTLACSIFGSENLIFLAVDEPELFERFSRTITEVTLKMAAVMDEEAGVSAQSRPGFSFADDNCCLLTPDMYRKFGYPVLKALEENFPPEASWTHPEGGFFVWVTLPEYMDTGSMLAEALEAGVTYVPGDSFFPGGTRGKNCMRINFSYETPENIEEAIRRLAGVIEDRLELYRAFIDAGAIGETAPKRKSE